MTSLLLRLYLFEPFGYEVMDVSKFGEGAPSRLNSLDEKNIYRTPDFLHEKYREDCRFFFIQFWKCFSMTFRVRFPSDQLRFKVKGCSWKIPNSKPGAGGVRVDLQVG